MSVRRFLVLLVGLAFALPLGAPAAGEVRSSRLPGPVGLNDCWPTDHGDPVLTGLSFGEQAVDLSHQGTVVTMRATAYDTAGPGPTSGLVSVVVSLDAYTVGEIGLDAVGPTVWVGRFQLRRSQLGPGRRHVRSVTLTDRDGNTRSYAERELASLGFAHTFVVRNTMVDRRAPLVEQLTVSRATVDSRRHAQSVTVLARLRDDLSGVLEATVALGDPDDAIIRSGMRKVRGSLRHGLWRARLHFPRWSNVNASSDLWMYVDDWADNNRFLAPADLPHNGRPVTITTRAARDHDDPVVRAGVPSARSIDVRAGDVALRVVVDAGDRTSGVAHVSVALAGAMGRLRLVSGSARQGRWSGVVRVSRCGALPGVQQLVVSVTDRASREMTRRWATVDVTADDTVRPTMRQAPGRSVGMIEVAFSEPVTNVDEAAVRSMPRTSSDPRGDPVVGTWICWDASRTLVDCPSGATSARFTAADPAALAEIFWADLVPDGAVGVADLAGNPLLGDPIAFDAGP